MFREGVVVSSFPPTERLVETEEELLVLVVWFVDMWFVLDDEAEEDESGDLCGLVSSRRTTAPKQTLASDIATMTVAYFWDHKMLKLFKEGSFAILPHVQ